MPEEGLERGPVGLITRGGRGQAGGIDRRRTRRGGGRARYRGRGNRRLTDAGRVGDRIAQHQPQRQQHDGDRRRALRQR